MGRLLSMATGCLRQAQRQVPHFGDESAKTAGMSRPWYDARCHDPVAAKPPAGVL